MAQPTFKRDAEPRSTKWWLDQDAPTPEQVTTAHPPQKPVRIASTAYLMGFEEVGLRSPTEQVSRTDDTTDHQANTDKQQEEEEEEEEDLIITEELTRVNSFDFVINEALDREANAAMHELIQNSVKYERTELTAVQPCVNGDRTSIKRYGPQDRAPHYVEDIELQDLDPEAGVFAPRKRKQAAKSKSESTASAICELM
ncbi:hypothetical protein CB0940_01395 [Cercospora beticola]|uniref:Uncharacterized protein n=1 Tax=Cercospora beticola TaxID=122368 RepID=A0A2G5IBM6_CERBT|nr:hypothetical protein CB0940_01395 [Cercospora beticola]PIB02266.1 hypothetical protein CB0940_01395 [Cercospora beticola]WPA96834.1 hypothetical protein RHO25_001442 [Cercospora beticola]